MMTKTTLSISGLLVAVASLWLVWAARSDEPGVSHAPSNGPAQPEPEPSAREPETLYPDAVYPGGIDFEHGWQPVFIDQDFIQTVQYGESAGDGGDAQLLYLRNASSNDGWDTSDEVVHAFHASFDILYVASERKDKFFLLGRPTGSTDPDEFVIERWKKTTITPMGLGGATGAPRVIMKRTELYRGTELGPLVGMGADPEGRFLLLVARSPTRVLKYFPDGSSDVQFFASQIPHLEEVTQLTPAEHEVLGRTWILEGGLEWTLLGDVDNDGTFDSFETLSAQQWDSDHAYSSSWLDDFLTLE